MLLNNQTSPMSTLLGFMILQTHQIKRAMPFLQLLATKKHLYFNDRSNYDIGSISSNTNSDADDSDDGPSITTEVVSRNGHDGTDVNSERRYKKHVHGMEITTHANEFHTLDADDEEDPNHEEYVNEQQELSESDNTETMDVPRKSNRLAGKSADMNFEYNFLPNVGHIPRLPAELYGKTKGSHPGKTL